MRQIVLDTETTGLKTTDGHRVIEIGCLEMVNRRITGESFHYYINPRRDVERGAEEVHGITTDFLQDKPYFEDIVQEFIDFVHGAELVIHNAPFDVGFLEYEFKLAKIKPVKISAYCGVLDTLKMARELHPGQRNSLDALCKRYHVNNKHREWHGALLDAELLAQVYLAMTGGQTALFGDKEVEKTAENQFVPMTVSQKSYPKTPVIYATAEELAAHEKFMR